MSLSSSLAILVRSAQFTAISDEIATAEYPSRLGGLQP